jgi:hypothetical protein
VLRTDLRRAKEERRSVWWIVSAFSWWQASPLSRTPQSPRPCPHRKAPGTTPRGSRPSWNKSCNPRVLSSYFQGDNCEESPLVGRLGSAAVTPDRVSLNCALPQARETSQNGECGKYSRSIAYRECSARSTVEKRTVAWWGPTDHLRKSGYAVALRGDLRHRSFI